MKPADALRWVRDGVSADRYFVKPHFVQRMDQRGLFWADVLAVLDAPKRVRLDGEDDHGRTRVLVTGEASDGLSLELLAVLDTDDDGNLTVFITLYWEN